MQVICVETYNTTADSTEVRINDTKICGCFLRRPIPRRLRPNVPGVGHRTVRIVIATGRPAERPLRTLAAEQLLEFLLAHLIPPASALCQVAANALVRIAALHDVRVRLHLRAERGSHAQRPNAQAAADGRQRLMCDGSKSYWCVHILMVHGRFHSPICSYPLDECATLDEVWKCFALPWGHTIRAPITGAQYIYTTTSNKTGGKICFNNPLDSTQMVAMRRVRYVDNYPCFAGGVWQWGWRCTAAGFSAGCWRLMPRPMLRLVDDDVVVKARSAVRWRRWSYYRVCVSSGDMGGVWLCKTLVCGQDAARPLCVCVML